MTDDTGRPAGEPAPDSGEEPTVTLSGASVRPPHDSGGTGEHPRVAMTGEHPLISMTGEHQRVATPEDGAGVAEPARAPAGSLPAHTEPDTAGVERDRAFGVPEPGPAETGGPEGAGRTATAAKAAQPSPDPSISAAAPATSDLGRGVRRPAPAGTLIWVLLALLGFTLVVQLRSNDADDGLSAARQEDLVRILSDLEAQDSRLLAEIQALEQSKQQLTSQVGGREAALAEAEKRSRELGLLAGTVPGRGPGLDITLSNVKAADVLNAVQELRGAGGEVMQLNGANGASVRVVASSFFVPAANGGIIADGEQLTGPLHLLVIGPANTMGPALQIPGGVVASVKSGGGSVTMDSRSLVEVTAVRKAAALRYASPVS